MLLSCQEEVARAVRGIWTRVGVVGTGRLAPAVLPDKYFPMLTTVLEPLKEVSCSWGYLHNTRRSVKQETHSSIQLHTKCCDSAMPCA